MKDAVEERVHLLRSRHLPWAVGVLTAVLLTTGCGADRDANPDPEHPPVPSGSGQVVGETLEVPPPPFSVGVFPCSNCHGMIPPNPVRRELTGFHTEIVLHHDEDNRWCLDCHDTEDRDQLHLASGALVPFEESYRLCGQCHGEKYRDWRAGVHGRRSGDWNGQKTYLLCAHCHDPHQPRFKAMEPMPPPVPPHQTVGKGVAR